MRGQVEVSVRAWLRLIGGLIATAEPYDWDEHEDGVR